MFKSLAAGEKPRKESDPLVPLVRVKKVSFKVGDWHHVVMNWQNFDTGKRNATAALYIDGQLIGELTDREIVMKWDLDRTGIYFAVNYIGLLDELLIFKQSLSKNEIQAIYKQPSEFSAIMKRRD